MLMHSPQPPFACSLCDHSATKMDALAAHVRKHLFLYTCCVCDRQLVSSYRLRSHLEETHPELDQERAFADCINISYCLIPLEGRGGSEEAQRGEMEEHKEGEDDRHEAVVDEEQDGEQKMKERVRSLDEGGEEHVTAGASEEEEDLRNKDPRDSSSNRCEVAAAEEQLNKTACSSAAEITNTSLSPKCVHNRHQKDGTQENTPSSFGPQVDNKQTSLSEKAKVVTNHKNVAIEYFCSVYNVCRCPDLLLFSCFTLVLFHQTAFQQVFSSLQKTQLDMDMFQRLRKIYGDLECQHCGKKITF